LASLAGLAALIVLSADVRQMYFWSQGMHCEDGDRNGCDAITEPAPPKPSTPAHQSRRLDANENLKLDANGNAAGFVVSSRTGARARVGSRYAARFQAYIDDLENNHGARVLFMGGIRPGSCSRASEHPCGKALDVCQLRRGVVDRRCKLPERAELGRIAASHGLFEGGRWCNSDYGHAQVDVTPACGESRNRIARKNTIEQQEQVPQRMPTLAASY
jgi:hypothetical protein